MADADHKGEPLALPLNDVLGRLPKAVHYWLEDVPVRAGPLMHPLYSAQQMLEFAAQERAAERARTAAAVGALKIAAQCIEAAYNDRWASADALSDDFDNAMSALADLLRPNVNSPAHPAA